MRYLDLIEQYVTNPVEATTIIHGDLLTLIQIWTKLLSELDKIDWSAPHESSLPMHDLLRLLAEVVCTVEVYNTSRINFDPTAYKQDIDRGMELCAQVREALDKILANVFDPELEVSQDYLIENLYLLTYIYSNYAKDSLFPTHRKSELLVKIARTLDENPKIATQIPTAERITTIIGLVDATIEGSGTSTFAQMGFESPFLRKRNVQGDELDIALRLLDLLREEVGIDNILSTDKTYIHNPAAVEWVRRKLDVLLKKVRLEFGQTWDSAIIEELEGLFKMREVLYIHEYKEREYIMGHTHAFVLAASPTSDANKLLIVSEEAIKLGYSLANATSMKPNHEQFLKVRRDYVLRAIAEIRLGYFKKAKDTLQDVETYVRDVFFAFPGREYNKIEPLRTMANEILNKVEELRTIIDTQSES
jgi:hypothetical protein